MNWPADTLSGIYLFLFAFGLIFSIATFFLGALAAHVHLPGGIHFGPHGHDGHLGHVGEFGHHGGDSGQVGHGHEIGGAHDVAHATLAGPSPLNLNTLMIFLTWFGATGYILRAYYSAFAAWSLLVALVIGLVGASIVYLFMAKVLWRGQRQLDPADYLIEGTVARVTSAIRAGGTGRSSMPSMGSVALTARAMSRAGSPPGPMWRSRAVRGRAGLRRRRLPGRAVRASRWKRWARWWRAARRRGGAQRRRGGEAGRRGGARGGPAIATRPRWLRRELTGMSWPSDWLDRGLSLPLRLRIDLHHRLALLQCRAMISPASILGGDATGGDHARGRPRQPQHDHDLPDLVRRDGLHRAHLGRAWRAWIALPLATAVGLVGGALVYLFLAKILWRGQSRARPGELRPAGDDRRVTSTIRAGGTGEIV